MKRSTLLTGLAGAATLLLAGCGTTEPAATASSTAAATTTASSSASGADTVAAAGPVTVTDARGTTVTLDGPAERVAVTEWNAAEYLVSLGVQPVGVADIAGFQTWDTSVTLDPDVTDIGTRGEPSLDTLGTLDLDLLIVTDQLTEGALEQIEPSIPVLVVTGGDAADPIGAMWSNVDLVAAATGTTDRAAELKTAFAATLDEGRAAMTAAGLAGTPVAFADGYDSGSAVSIRPYTSGSLVGAVFSELGLVNGWPGIEGDPAYGLGSTDVEGLTTIGDPTFWYIANDAEIDPFGESLAGNAVWQSLPFVQAGKVHRFPDSIWMFGGPASMTQIVEAAIAIAGGAATGTTASTTG